MSVTNRLLRRNVELDSKVLDELTQESFFLRLELRLCEEWRERPAASAPGLWCDGLLSESWDLRGYPALLEGRVIVGGLPGRHPSRYQETWRFMLLLAVDVESPSDILWEQLFPAADARGWWFLDVEAGELFLELPATGGRSWLPAPVIPLCRSPGAQESAPRP